MFFSSTYIIDHHSGFLNHQQLSNPSRWWLSWLNYSWDGFDDVKKVVGNPKSFSRKASHYETENIETRKGIEKDKTNLRLFCLKAFWFNNWHWFIKGPFEPPKIHLRNAAICHRSQPMQDVSIAICRRFAEKCKNPLCLGGLKPTGFTSDLGTHGATTKPVEVLRLYKKELCTDGVYIPA